MARATALAMLAEKITAAQAVEIGLIYRACPAASLDEEASKLAVHLATQPTLGLGLTKRLLNAAWVNDLETQLELEAECQGAAGRSADYAEGVAAFLAKRKPVFTGQLTRASLGPRDATMRGCPRRRGPWAAGSPRWPPSRDTRSSCRTSMRGRSLARAPGSTRRWRGRPRRAA